MTEQASVTMYATNLFELLAELQGIRRKIKLPDGQEESDSHHALSLALVSFELCKNLYLDIDYEKLLIYALVHDFPGPITGDKPTLMMSASELDEKYRKEQDSLPILREKLRNYPSILREFDNYSRLDSREAAIVFILDKAYPNWTHFHDSGSDLKSLGARTREDFDAWYSRVVEKIDKRLNIDAPKEAIWILRDSYEKVAKHVYG